MILGDVHASPVRPGLRWPGRHRQGPVRRRRQARVHQGHRVAVQRGAAAGDPQPDTEHEGRHRRPHLGEAEPSAGGRRATGPAVRRRRRRHRGACDPTAVRRQDVGAVGRGHPQAGAVQDRHDAVDDLGQLRALVRQGWPHHRRQGQRDVQGPCRAHGVHLVPGCLRQGWRHQAGQAPRQVDQGDRRDPGPRRALQQVPVLEGLRRHDEGPRPRRDRRTRSSPPRTSTGPPPAVAPTRRRATRSSA